MSIERLNSLLGNKIKNMSEVQTAWCTVKSIDWDKKLMDVVGIVDDLEYYDVLLGLGSEDKKPVIGCTCIIGIIGNESGNSFLIYAEELEEIEIKVGSSLLHVKKDGFILKQNSESLKTVLNDLIDELNKIVVIQGRSINVPAMTLIKQRLNKILIG
jgi:hypothetical protein